MATSHMSKRHRALLRKELVQYLPDYAGPKQFGGIKGRGTDMASLTLWTHQAYAQSKGLSSAYMFIDAVSAFYRSLRQLIFYCAETNANLPHLIASQFVHNTETNLWEIFQNGWVGAPLWHDLREDILCVGFGATADARVVAALPQPTRVGEARAAALVPRPGAITEPVVALVESQQLVPTPLDGHICCSSKNLQLRGCFVTSYQLRCTLGREQAL